MTTIIGAGALLTILFFVVLLAVLLLAATWDALVALLTELKTYWNEIQ